MKTSLLFLMLIISGACSFAQHTFSKVYFDSTDYVYGYSIAATNDNGFLIAGSKPPAGLIFKIDSAGTILWDKNIPLEVMLDLTG